MTDQNYHDQIKAEADQTIAELRASLDRELMKSDGLRDLSDRLRASELEVQQQNAKLQAEIDLHRQCAVTVRKCRRWLHHVAACEEDRDEAVCERAEFDLDQALDVIEKLADPSWGAGYVERVKESNLKRAEDRNRIKELEQHNAKLREALRDAAAELGRAALAFRQSDHRAIRLSNASTVAHDIAGDGFDEAAIAQQDTPGIHVLPNGHQIATVPESVIEAGRRCMEHAQQNGDNDD